MWASSWPPPSPTPVLHLLMLRKPSLRSGRRQGPRGRARGAVATDSVPWGLECSACGRVGSGEFGGRRVWLGLGIATLGGEGPS